MCDIYVQERIDRAQSAIAEAQKAANNESKSSAGDKYETGRAMMHLEKEKHASQLSEAVKLKQVLDQINPDLALSAIGLGAIVETNQGYFYFAIGAGKLSLEGKDYFAIAPAAPIGQKLMGLQVGESTTFNGRTFQVLALA